MMKLAIAQMVLACLYDTLLRCVSHPRLIGAWVWYNPIPKSKESEDSI